MKTSPAYQKCALPILWVVLAFLFLSSSALACHKVVRIYDGDTVLLENGIQVRYLGIDTPEIDHEGGRSDPMAEEAADVNRKLVEGRCVKLEYDQEKVDSHGRRLAYLFLPNGEMVNAMLVRRGLAHVMSIRPNLKYRDLLVGCQREAMAEGVGIWRSLSKGVDIRIGNSSSYRFHRPDCPFAKRIFKGNRLRFRSRFEAFWEGYAPCRRCRP
ncbi:MAG: micrococcal nuclease [Thermodesulfobacteriota bacterium]|nr:micrococcal nuclease [Thermodesulfobacteriota bacterium]